MADLRGFDANQVEPSSDFEPIPAGKYLAVITETEMKPTKSGAGSYLQLTFQIIEGAAQEPPAVGATEPQQPECDCGADRQRGIVCHLSGGRRVGAWRQHRVAQPAVGDPRSL